MKLTKPQTFAILLVDDEGNADDLLPVDYEASSTKPAQRGPYVHPLWGPAQDEALKENCRKAKKVLDFRRNLCYTTCRQSGNGKKK